MQHGAECHTEEQGCACLLYTSYLLLMNDGPTRPMDARAMTFLQRFDTKLTVVDAKDFGLSSVIKSSVVELSLIHISCTGRSPYQTHRSAPRSGSPQ